MKGSQKNSSAWRQIFILISVVILGMFVGQYLFIGFAYMKYGAASLGDLNEFVSQINGNAHLLRQSLFFQTLCSFFFPALILSWLFSDDIRQYLYMERGFSGGVVALTILSVLFLMPLLNASVYWTQQIPFPESLKAVEAKIALWEEQAQQMAAMILTTDKYLTFLINLLIVAILTAIGEEFLFRGVLQNIFSKVFKNPHAVIWTVGIIFSFVHFQFYGFFARAFLGVYLGYLLYYGKSIWVPILAHFTQNAMGVISFYSIKDPKLLEKIDQIGTGSTSWVALLSLVLFSATVVLLIKKCKSQNFLS